MHSDEALRNTESQTMEHQVNDSLSAGTNILTSGKSEIAYAEAWKANEEELRNMQQEFSKYHNPRVESVQHAKTVVLALYWEKSDMEGLVQEVSSIDTEGTSISPHLGHVLDKRKGLADTDAS